MDGQRGKLGVRMSEAQLKFNEQNQSGWMK